MTLSRSNPRRKPRWFALLALLTFGTLILATSVFAAPTFTFIADDQGANDEPGQKDLTADAAAFDVATGDFFTAWKWDDTAWSGSNTGDACSLFDTDADGNANYAICLTIGKPAVETSTRVYSCGDTRPDRCTGSVLEGTESTTNWCSVSQVSATFPPPPTGGDTQATCNASQVDDDVANVTGLGSGTLLNSCSYPSQQPNSDPSDCVHQIATVVTTTSTQIKNTNGTPDVGNDTNVSDGGAVAIGTVVYDTATLGGNTAMAGGTVSYFYRKQAATDTSPNCTSGTQIGSAVTVTNGSVPASATVTLSTAGTYEFWAVYSGSTNNLGSTSPCGSETVVVNRNTTTTSTQIKNTNGTADVGNDTNVSDGGSVTIGTVVYDTVTLGNTAMAGGSVSYFSQKQSATDTSPNCTSGTQIGSAVTVTNGSVPASATVTLSTAGTYEFWAVYSGDDNNLGSTSTCGSETVVVNANANGISTSQTLVPNDSATLTGLTSDAGGTITFKLFPPSNPTCSTAPEAAAPIVNQTVNVAGGQATYSTTNSVSVTTQGTYRWLVIYTGDGNNSGATSACGVEIFTVDNNTTD